MIFHHLPYRFLFYFEKRDLTINVTLFRSNNSNELCTAPLRFAILRTKKRSTIGYLARSNFFVSFLAIPRPGLVSGRLGWAQNAEIFWESLFKKKLLLQNFYFYEQNNKKKIYNCKINLNFDNIVDIIKTLKKPTYEQKNWERALRVKHNFALIKIFKF